jgi:FSR family fosmidomycin resistance protein-like MFS transporter
MRDTERPDGGFETRRVTMIAAAHAVHDTFTAFLPPLLPRLIERLSLTNTAAGSLSAFLSIPSLLQPFVGRIADRTTLRVVVIGAPAVTSVLMSMLGWASGYAVLAILLFTAGISVAGFHAVAPAAVGRLSGERLGRGMGFWMVGGEVGRTLGPIVVVSALGVLGLRSLALLSVFGIAASVVLWIHLRDAPLEEPTGAAALPWRAALAGMRRLMLILCGVVAMRALMMMASVTYLAVYLTEEGVSEWFAGASLSIVEAAGIAGALAGGWISDRIGRRAVLFVGHLTAPLCLFALLAAEGWLRVPVLMALGMTLLSIQPVNMALVQEQFPETRAFANGVYLSMSFAIRSVAAVGFGMMADAFGLRVAFATGGVAMLTAIPLVFLLPDRTPAPASVER